MLVPFDAPELDIRAPAEPINLVVPLNLIYSHIAAYLTKENTSAAGALVSLMKVAGQEIDINRLHAVLKEMTDDIQPMHRRKGECVKA